MNPGAIGADVDNLRYLRPKQCMPHGDDIYRRALQLGRAGEIEAAIGWLHSHSHDIAGHAAALGLMGTLLSMQEKPGQALGCFMRSIAVDPRQPVVHSDMGIALTKLNRPNEALACFNQALGLNPRHVQALNNRSQLLLTLEQGEPALIDAEAALALQPRLMAAHRNRTRALLLLDRTAEALESVDFALTLDEKNAENHASRGKILDALGRHDEAISAFDRAVSLSSYDAGLRFGRACSHLRHHEFAAGWRDYQHRWSEPGFVRTSWRQDAALLQQRDSEHARIDGQHVLVLDEQGIGDEIMFASVLRDLLQHAASVTWAASRRLQRLFKASFPTVEFVEDLDGLDLRAFDRILPAGDLCNLYRNDLANFVGAPYLRPTEDTSTRWRQRLGHKEARIRVGLSWKGGLFNTGQSRRSLSLDSLEPLLRREDCEFVSLQYGAVQTEIEAANIGAAKPIRCFPQEDTEDFEDLAALVLSLDAVVSVQTALVHLAGAVGATCFAMIPTYAEWRYGDQGETMPWYSSVKLIRQTQPSDWSPVLKQIGKELDRLAGNGTN